MSLSTLLYQMNFSGALSPQLLMDENYPDSDDESEIEHLDSDSDNG